VEGGKKETAPRRKRGKRKALPIHLAYFLLNRGGEEEGRGGDVLRLTFPKKKKKEA